MFNERYMHLLDKWQVGVGKLIQRIYAATTDKHWLVEENKMKQARCLNDKELKLLLIPFLQFAIFQRENKNFILLVLLVIIEDS